MADAACPDTGLQILWYPARYHSGMRSIFAMGDMMNLMEGSKMDVAILEEPEHCNWFRAPGDGWTKRFHYVVGIVHTSTFVFVNMDRFSFTRDRALNSQDWAILFAIFRLQRVRCHSVAWVMDSTCNPDDVCGNGSSLLSQGD